MNTMTFIKKSLSTLGKLFLLFIFILKPLVYLIVFLFATEWFWPEFWGSHDLGNSIYMLDWDGDTRVIVKGENLRGRTCYGGGPIIPKYELAYDSLGRFAEYVTDAQSDDDWIIVRCANKQSTQIKYYIIDKSFNTNISPEEIIDNYIYEFSDSLAFARACKDKGIKIEW